GGQQHSACLPVFLMSMNGSNCKSCDSLTIVSITPRNSKSCVNLAASAFVIAMNRPPVRSDRSTRRTHSSFRRSRHFDEVVMPTPLVIPTQEESVLSDSWQSATSPDSALRSE
ncbi:MAG TPA: hypothetical protein VFQ80_15090, partial [Thermomicrobiales bacterium]|nr:hypothetical protein [Thermomicrobiales bacterium]